MKHPRRKMFLWIIATWFLFLATWSRAELPLIPNELKHLPVLVEELERSWPLVPCRSCLAAQVRQETCAGLKSKRCWSPYAELKTNREYGFGLGQLTVTSKFDNFKEAKKLDPTLRGWAWENRYNAVFQLRTLVLMDKMNYSKFSWASSSCDRMAFSVAAYNGGVGGVLSDRTVCRNTPGCDSSRWFNHVERTSRKAKVAASGYGKSFFEINREYVQHILLQYPSRYRPFFKESGDVCAN